MRTYIIINGREITNPVIKFILLAAMLLVSFVVTILLIFVILPLLGIAITLSVGFLVSLLIAIFISLPVLVLMLSLLSRFMGETELRIRK